MNRYISLLAVIVAALSLPASAAAAPGSIIAVDHEEFGQLFMDASQTNPLDNSVTISPGETVTFSYPVGTSAHNVGFLATGPQPASCTQTAGIIIPELPIPPLPAFSQGPGWSGFCTFNTPGTVNFLCPVHPIMTGTVIVAAPANQPPTVSASRTPAGDVTTGTAISFSATGSDPDDDPLTYAWEFGDGSTSSSQNPSHTYTAPGTYSAKVTVSDGRGGSADTTLTVMVTQANRAPTVTASRTPSGNVAAGTAIEFSAVGSDPDGDPLTYSWDFGDAGTSTAQNPTHAYAAAGDFTARVTVSDGRGGTATADVAVTVTGANQNPTVTAERTPSGNTRVGIPIAFAATGTDPDGDPLTYAWDFGDGDTSTEQNPTHAFLTASTFTVRVTVSDGRGGTGSATLSVVVQANRAPTISSATATPAEGVAPLAVQFAATATDPDGHAVSYEWDLDADGTFETAAQNPSFTYIAAKSPVLRVSDGFGGSVTRTLTINALPEVLDPNARFNVLVFSKTAGFRHSNIDEGIAAIKLMGGQQNFTVDAVEDASLFTDAFLARYDAVIWLSTTGDVLNDAQQAAFERYIQSGKGYVGIHAAADTEYTWGWYGRLVGAYFRNHPNGTPSATIVVEDSSKPSTSHLPARWTRNDEWYNFQGIENPVVNGGGVDVSPRGLTPIHVLLTMDEATYTEADGTDGVNDDHPIAWCKRYDGGRMFYTGLAHTEASFVDANFLAHLRGGLEVAAGAIADEDCGVPPNAVPSLNASRTPAGIVDVGEAVAFTAGATDADGDTLTYAWEFGDGGTSSEPDPTHTYTTAGAYQARVTVTDGRGGSATATLPVTVAAFSTDTPGDVGASVDLVLALSIGGPATFGTIVPGVSGEYTASVAAAVTSTAGEATLTVADPSPTMPGRLVNDDYALESPLQVRATNAANPETAFAPVAGTPLTLLSYPRAVSVDEVTLGFRQAVGENETLRAGGYGKTLTFTLSTTTP